MWLLRNLLKFINLIERQFPITMQYADTWDLYVVNYRASMKSY